VPGWGRTPYALCHASIKAAGDVYVQTIEESVLNAMNSRTMGILAGWEHPALIDAGAMNAGVEEASLGPFLRAVPTQRLRAGRRPGNANTVSRDGSGSRPACYPSGGTYLSSALFLWSIRLMSGANSASASTTTPTQA
jgi:hypothetical protein